MHGRLFGGILAAIVLASAVPAHAVQCVPFARAESGIGLRGDAWTWWRAAAGVYARGAEPSVGAVIVFKRHGRMRHGHVAVVRRIIDSRTVLVDHANWAPHRGVGRGKVSMMVAVRDVSPGNDWTDVRVWNRRAQDFGPRAYPTYGFIYPSAAAHHHGHGVRRASAPASEPVAVPYQLSLADPVEEMPELTLAAAGLSAEPTAPISVDIRPMIAPAAAIGNGGSVFALPALATESVAASDQGDAEWAGDRQAAMLAGAGHY